MNKDWLYLVLSVSLLGQEVVLDLSVGIQVDSQGVALALRLGAAHVQRVLGHVDLGKGAPVPKVSGHSGHPPFPASIGWADLLEGHQG